jgi:hypothetical protein
VLPDELKEEVNRIISYRLIGLDMRILVRIEHHENDLVRVTMSVEKTIKNISRHTEKTFNLAAIDEWGFPGSASRIIKCIMVVGDKVFSGNLDHTHDDPRVSMGQRTEEYALGPSETVRFIAEWYEIYRNNSAAEILYNAACEAVSYHSSQSRSHVWV